jgi:hypothetical protein
VERIEDAMAGESRDDNPRARLESGDRRNHKDRRPPRGLYTENFIQ